MAQNSEDELDKTIVSGSDTFNGRVRAADDSPPTLVVLIGPAGYVGKQFALTEQEHILGRSIDCQIYIDDKSVSRNHARFEVTGKDVLVQDLGSSNKTYINNEELAPNAPARLLNNDQLKTGNVIFKFLESGNLEAITNKELNEKAAKDAMTGAWSKGALIEKGPEAIKRSEVLAEELSVLVFDIDFFKKVNDTYGHAGGDCVLRELGRLVSTKVVRSHDYFARYGGEEFVILLPAAGIKTALDVAERLRTMVESYDFHFEDKQIHVTISIGCATKKSVESYWDTLFKRADEALYQSKQTGRNRVTLAP